ncbi:hypothetical protein L596_021617 [Steinernema carpocapsae]|uniref:Reverse transcriptase domain-containing protein n=1 Tax=Steinernema carpocapsae TaxID=34508 RepID=A0A4U5MJC4_STECR|nr:hypothetical protein L596_021617 [Steinernema carpocapsae]
MRQALRLLEEWSSKWRLPISASETVVVRVGKNNPRSDFEGKSIAKVSVFKDLGVAYDNNLSFEPHLKIISLKAARLCKMVLRVFKCRNLSVLWKLFICYIRPILDHACIVWSPQTAKNSLLIESIQRKFVKAIFARCGARFS